MLPVDLVKHGSQIFGVLVLFDNRLGVKKTSKRRILTKGQGNKVVKVSLLDLVIQLFVLMSVPQTFRDLTYRYPKRLIIRGQKLKQPTSCPFKACRYCAKFVSFTLQKRCKRISVSSSWKENTVSSQCGIFI